MAGRGTPERWPGLRTTRAPISLARLLMEQGPHVFLSGRGADEFARGAGLEQVPTAGSKCPSGGDSCTSC